MARPPSGRPADQLALSRPVCRSGSGAPSMSRYSSAMLTSWRRISGSVHSCASRKNRSTCFRRNSVRSMASSAWANTPLAAVIGLIPGRFEAVSPIRRCNPAKRTKKDPAAMSGGALVSKAGRWGRGAEGARQDSNPAGVPRFRDGQIFLREAIGSRRSQSREGRAPFSRHGTRISPSLRASHVDPHAAAHRFDPCAAGSSSRASPCVLRSSRG